MVLQDLVQPFYPQSAFPHRRHDLNFIFLCLDVAGKLFLDQSNGGTYDSIRIVAADEKKIPASLGQIYRLAFVDAVSIYNDIALSCLTEDTRQLYYIKTAGAYDIF